MYIPFNRPFLTGSELDFVADAHNTGQLAGDGKYTKLASDYLSGLLQGQPVLLTHSCTAALEMAAVLLNVAQGDEVIMPSYTFVSTANAFVLRGATPVFVDVDPLTFNLNPDEVEAAITPSTRCIVPVHYAGMSCDMRKLCCIAEDHNIPVVEDAAQAILSTCHGRPLGTYGSVSTFSFHETKNIISGEGGAITIKDQRLVERAEIIREKGTNRSRFFRGEVDKYTWVDIGSSYLPGEVIAAFLYAQIRESRSITLARLRNWDRYHCSFQGLEERGLIRRPSVPEFCEHNGHMYYIVTRSLMERQALIQYLKAHGICAVFHYVPLHSSPAGIKYCRTHGHLPNTQMAADCLLRLPMGAEVEVDVVIECIQSFYSRNL